jgi:hypothetical protein
MNRLCFSSHPSVSPGYSRFTDGELAAELGAGVGTARRGILHPLARLMALKGTGTPLGGQPTPPPAQPGASSGVDQRGGDAIPGGPAGPQVPRPILSPRSQLHARVIGPLLGLSSYAADSHAVHDNGVPGPQPPKPPASPASAARLQGILVNVRSTAERVMEIASRSLPGCHLALSLLRGVSISLLKAQLTGTFDMERPAALAQVSNAQHTDKRLRPRFEGGKRVKVRPVKTAAWRLLLGVKSQGTRQATGPQLRRVRKRVEKAPKQLRAQLVQRVEEDTRKAAAAEDSDYEEHPRKRQRQVPAKKALAKKAPSKKASATPQVSMLQNIAKSGERIQQLAGGTGTGLAAQMRLLLACGVQVETAAAVTVGPRLTSGAATPVTRPLQQWRPPMQPLLPLLQQRPLVLGQQGQPRTLGAAGLVTEGVQPRPNPDLQRLLQVLAAAKAQAGMGPGAVTGLGSGLGQGLAPGAVMGSGSGLRQGMVPGTWLGQGLGPGTVMGSGAVMGPGAVTGSGTWLGQGMGPGTVMGSGAVMGPGAVTGSGTWLGQGMGPGAVTGSGSGLGQGMGSGAVMGSGSGLGQHGMIIQGVRVPLIPWQQF